MPTLLEMIPLLNCTQLSNLSIQSPSFQQLKILMEVTIGKKHKISFWDYINYLSKESIDHLLTRMKLDSGTLWYTLMLQITMAESKGWSIGRKQGFRTVSGCIGWSLPCNDQMLCLQCEIGDGRLARTPLVIRLQVAPLTLEAHDTSVSKSPQKFWMLPSTWGIILENYHMLLQYAAKGILF